MSNKNKKNSKKKRAQAQVKAVDSGAATKRAVIIFVSVFVGIAIIFGASLGIASAVKHASYILHNEGIGVDGGLVNYFTAYRKNIYIQNINNSAGEAIASDTPEFWNTAPYEGTSTTYGGFFKVELETYIKRLIASNVIFDEMYRLTREDKDNIKIAIANVFESLRVSSRKEFNEKAEQFGFDYKDMAKAAEMIYKEREWYLRTFGTDGSGVGAFPDFCDEFLENYNRVKLIFIRTETKYQKDENGNRIPGNGSYLTEELTAEEKLERQEYIEKLKTCISEINEGNVGEQGFDSYAAAVKNAYGEINTAETEGYYLLNGSAFTASYAGAMPKVVESALKLDIGKGAFVELKASDTSSDNSFVGYCFMYRVDVEERAYTNTARGDFFGDFGQLASSALFNKMVEEYAEFETGEKWSDVSIINIPYIPYIPNYVPQFNL